MESSRCDLVLTTKIYVTNKNARRVEQHACKSEPNHDANLITLFIIILNTAAAILKRPVQLATNAAVA